MAIKLEQITESKKMLEIISVKDSAIDWDNSYSQEEDFQDEDSETKNSNDEIADSIETQEFVSLEKRKKDHYQRHHDASKLKFKIDDTPTVFVFHHPHRADVSKKMRELASQMYADRSKKEKVERDMFSSVFHYFYVGTKQGFGSELEKANKINNKIPDSLIQALEDAEVFIELNSAFMRVYNQDRTKTRDKNFVGK